MLVVAFVMFGVAVLIGSILAVLHLREGAAAKPPWPFGALHGLLAIGGLVGLVLMLGGSPRGLDQGTASFGNIAAVFLALAAVVGITLFAAGLRKRKLPAVLIGIHATLAVSGFVILAAYVFPG
ncbi:MAG TPA: hypothetical protein VFL51_01615 [Pseudolabrys sp.]|nr:hypothetical protein [Pseudolabrys sp.]